jgi:hypothetical protein
LTEAKQQYQTSEYYVQNAAETLVLVFSPLTRTCLLIFNVSSILPAATHYLKSARELSINKSVSNNFNMMCNGSYTPVYLFTGRQTHNQDNENGSISHTYFASDDRRSAISGN